MKEQRATMYIINEKGDNKGYPRKVGYVYTPKTHFVGGEIKWYQDTYKTDRK